VQILTLCVKAVFTGAIVPCDQRDTVRLLKRLIVCLACASTDEQHPGVRYARLLNGLLRTFSRGTDYVESGAQTPTKPARHSGEEVEEIPPRALGPQRSNLVRFDKRAGRADAWPASAAQSPHERCAQLPVSAPPPPLAQLHDFADPSSSQADVYDLLSMSSNAIFDNNPMSSSQP
jgi:hypothetical protein